MKQRLVQWVEDHLRAAIGSMGRLYRHRLGSAMTVLVIGISVALPTGFLLALQNMESLTGSWEGAARISMFLHGDVGDAEANELADSLRDWEGVVGVEFVPPDAALAEFRQLSGMGDALDLLDENPLPAMLVLEPTTGLDAADLQTLTTELEMLGPVEQARLDLQWVQRLDAIMQLMRRGVWLISLLLAISVVLIVGNTVRLAIENRREEIIITKLIGATNAFIRRPFLYEGVWYGLAGGLLAVILVEGGRLLLQGPADRLATLYQTGPLLHGLGFQGGLAVLLGGTALGLIGSWMAVARHLAAIEPR